MKTLLWILLALPLAGCELTQEEEPVRGNQHLSTILNRQGPLDTSDPTTGQEGYFEQVQGQPKTTMNPAWCNGVTDELLFAHQELDQPAGDSTSQLARGMETAVGLPASTLSIIQVGDPGDYTTHNVSYQRYGRTVRVDYHLVYRNTDAGIAGNPASYQLPFQKTSEPAELVVDSNVSIFGSNFQADNLAAAVYEFEPLGSGVFTIGMFRSTSPTATTAVRIGGDSVDGAGLFRTIRATLGYKTDGVRNPDWPYVRFLNWTHTILPSAELYFQYESAKVGDDVELLNGALAVVDTFPVGAATPDGKGQFVVAVADTYRLRLRGVLSRPFQVQ